MNFVILWPVLTSILWPSNVTTVPFTVDRAIVEQKKAGKTQERVRWNDHLSVHFGKGTHVELRGRFQGDLRESDALLDAAEDSSGLDIARRRIGAAGEIRNAVDFQIEGELGSDEPWRDVYANYRQHPVLQVQGGQFKLPFSLDETEH